MAISNATFLKNGMGALTKGRTFCQTMKESLRTIIASNRQGTLKYVHQAIQEGDQLCWLPYVDMYG